MLVSSTAPHMRDTTNDIAYSRIVPGGRQTYTSILGPLMTILYRHIPSHVSASTDGIIQRAAIVFSNTQPITWCNCSNLLCACHVSFSFGFWQYYAAAVAGQTQFLLCEYPLPTHNVLAWWSDPCVHPPLAVLQVQLGVVQTPLIAHYCMLCLHTCACASGVINVHTPC